MLSELVPGNLNTFFYTLGGAEANEKRHKGSEAPTPVVIRSSRDIAAIMGQRMPQCSSPVTLGDSANEPGMPGVVHVMDPNPYDYSFGATDEEKVARNLQYLEEVIMYEGPETIAAMFIETVTGTNGILPPPKGYLQGLRALLDKYGILLVCDEVMWIRAYR